MGMTSRADLLLSYLSEIRRVQPALRPGRWDCAIYAGTWVQRCTGKDVIGDWRRSYSSFESGFEALSKQGLNSLSDLAASHLQEIFDPQDYQPGDVAVLFDCLVEAFGIIGGPHVYVLAQPSNRALSLDIASLSLVHRVFRP